MTEDLPAPSDRNFLFYDTENGTTRVQLLVDGQTVWMPQKAIAELFETSVANINTHIRNILGDSEVEADSVIKDYLITAADGKSYKTKHRGTEDTEFSSAHPLCDLCASVPLCFKSFLAEKMEGLTRELATQFHESEKLQSAIRDNMQKLGFALPEVGE